MKLTDLYKNADEPSQPGTYAGVRFSADTVKALQEYAKQIKVPKKVPGKEYHTTLLYSRKPIDSYVAEGVYNREMIGTPMDLEVWPNQSNTANVLVLTYSCPLLYQRHHKLGAI